MFFQADRTVGRCVVCSKLKHERAYYLAAHDMKHADEMKQLIERHNYHQQRERQENSRRAQMAHRHPTKYIHIIADGMDSKKTEVHKMSFANYKFVMFYHPPDTIQSFGKQVHQ